MRNVQRFGFALALSALVGPAFGEASEPPPARLNVLLIVGDDLNTSLGCYGHPLVKTPHIDQLAQGGVRFERAYCQYPLCNPSRTSFLSGIRPGGRVKDAVWIADHFSRHGYFTMEIGKTAHGYGSSRTLMHWDLSEPNPKPATPPPAEVRRTTGPVPLRAIELLEKYRDRPFFLAVGMAQTHPGSPFPGQFARLYPRDQVPLPVEPAEHLRDIPDVARPPDHFNDRLDEAEQRSRTAVYFGAVSSIDHEVGVILAALDRLGLRDRTVIVFTADHGKHLGEHGGFWGKMSLYEQSARVPLIIAAPGKKAGAVSPRLAELVDLYPTLTDLCGLPAPDGLQGTSLVPLLEDPQRPWKKAAFTVTDRPGGIRGRSVRTERFRYTEWGDEKTAQLFDHDKDPREYRNLAGDPSYAEVVVQMRGLLDAGWQGARPAAAETPRR